MRFKAEQLLCFVLSHQTATDVSDLSVVDDAIDGDVLGDEGALLQLLHILYPGDSTRNLESYQQSHYPQQRGLQSVHPLTTFAFSNLSLYAQVNISRCSTRSICIWLTAAVGLSHGGMQTMEATNLNEGRAHRGSDTSPEEEALGERALHAVLEVLHGGPDGQRIVVGEIHSLYNDMENLAPREYHESLFAQ